MKYYIDDKLVRTSDRVYTHAVLKGDRVVSCAGSFELAQKALTREGFFEREALNENKAAIRAIDAGKTEFQVTTRRGWYKVRVTGTREQYESRVAYFEEVLKSYHIRELEAR